MGNPSDTGWHIKRGAGVVNMFILLTADVFIFLIKYTTAVDCRQHKKPYSNEGFYRS